VTDKSLPAIFTSSRYRVSKQSWECFVESSKSNGWILVGAGFVAGAIFGGLVLPELRGYSSFDECVVREMKPSMSDEALMAVKLYCDERIPYKRAPSDK